MDTQDLITAGGISDIEDGYFFLSDLGLIEHYFLYDAQKLKTSTNLFSKMK